MIKLNSISANIYVVNDIAKTAVFYKTLGFRFAEQTDIYLKCYVNWYWVEFHKGTISRQDVAQSMAISVPDVDEFHEHIKAKGLQPENEPHDQPWGRRDFTLRDPDGYRLLFFQKTK